MVPSFLNRLNARGWVTLYDCRDDWEEFGKVMPLPWYSPAAERHILSNTDATFCVSSTLVEKMRSWGGVGVHLSPNAYDPAFRSADYVRRPSERAVVGYFGHLTDRWFDYPSLVEIARRRPEYLFEIVGDGAPNGLDLPPNVVLLGPKRHSEIGHLAARWRVGIIPFRVGKLADAVDPIKIYEYLALGLPVVSFRMPQIADYPYTTTVESPEAFAAALDRAISTRVDPARTRSFLEASTWTARAAQILSIEAEVRRAAPYEKTLSSGEP
jgi:glycosyltransferase involved in cell wall biosynthesis